MMIFVEDTYFENLEPEQKSWLCTACGPRGPVIVYSRKVVTIRKINHEKWSLPLICPRTITSLQQAGEALINNQRSGEKRVVVLDSNNVNPFTQRDGAIQINLYPQFAEFRRDIEQTSQVELEPSVNSPFIASSPYSPSSGSTSTYLSFSSIRETTTTTRSVEALYTEIHTEMQGTETQISEFLSDEKIEEIIGNITALLQHEESTLPPPSPALATLLSQSITFKNSVIDTLEDLIATKYDNIEDYIDGLLAIINTPLDRLLTICGEDSRLRWYLMDALLTAAKAKSLATASADYLENKLDFDKISGPLKGCWLLYLNHELTKFRRSKKSWDFDFLQAKPTMPVKPDSPLDRAHKALDTVKVIQLLISTGKNALKEKCHESQTYEELMNLDARNRENLACSMISQTVKVVGDDPKNNAQTLASSIESTAFASVLGDKIIVIQNEITRLKRIDYIATYRQHLNCSYTPMEQNSTLKSFIEGQIEKLTTIIEDKLTSYTAGPWADKTVEEIETEFAVLAIIRDSLINFTYTRSGNVATSEPSNTIIDAKAYAAHLATVIAQIKIANTGAFKKHGRMARFAGVWNIEVKSKLDVFCERLIEDAAKVNDVTSTITLTV